MKYYNVDPHNIILRDYLAKDRTMLANERTFLAFLRTSIGFFGTGAGCVKFLDEPVISIIGYMLIVLSPVMFIWGIMTYLNVTKRINSISDNDLLMYNDGSDEKNGENE